MSPDNFNNITAPETSENDLNHIVEILAVQVTEFRKTDLISCMNRLGYRDKKNQAFSYRTIQPLLTRLAETDSMVQSEKGLSCPDRLWLNTIEHLAIEHRYTPIATAVLTLAPLFKPRLEPFYPFNDIKEFYRAILIAVFTNEAFADLDLVYRSGRRCKKFYTQKTPPLVTLFSQPFNPGLLDRIDRPLRWKLLGYILEDALRKTIPVQDIVTYGISLLSENPGSDTEYRLLDHLLITGQMGIHRKFLAGYPDSESVSHLVQVGKSEMLCKNNDAALPFFRHALAIMEKAPSKKSYPITNASFVFIFISLLAGGDPADVDLGMDWIRHVLHSSDDDNSYTKLFSKGLLPLFLSQAGRRTDPVMAEDLISGDDPLSVFFSILVLSWHRCDRAKPYGPMLETVREKTVAWGGLWLTAEICALLARLGRQTDINTVEAKVRHDALGTKTLVYLFTPVSDWEKALSSMIRMGEPSEKELRPSGGRLPEQRMIWQLIHTKDEKKWHLTPRVQKRNKNSTWTRGKPVDLTFLRDTYLKLDWLTPQDHRVCAAMEAVMFPNAYGYGNKPYIRLNMEKALPALVDHPLIFLGEGLDTQVTFASGNPELQVQEIDNRLHIQMIPRPVEQMNSVALFRETATRFRVVSFSPDHINLSRMIGENGLIIPKKEGNRVGRAIASISSLLTVTSDMESDEMQAIEHFEADPSIHVHLVPWHSGIKMEILIRPFGQIGPYFRPGTGGRHVLTDMDGKKARIVRDLVLEKENEQKVVQTCPTLDQITPVNGEWGVKDPEQALELMLELKTCPENPILKWPQGKKLTLRPRVTFSNLSLTLKKERDWFKVTGRIAAGDDLSMDLFRLMALLESSTGRFIPLDDGTFLAITQSLKDRLMELKAYSTPHKDGVRFSPLAALAMEEFMQKAGSLTGDEAWDVHCRRLKETIHPQIPHTLKTRLRDYQVTGFNWLCQLAHWQVGGCLADDMGLGKTIQSLAAILVHACKGPSLVVAPLSVTNNWKQECQNFAPGLNPVLFGGKNRQQLLDNLKPWDLVICSYSLLPIEAKKLAGIEWQTVVLDEAQAIKNRKTQRSRAAMRLNAKFRLITTGTPLENHLEELWTLFHFLNPGLLGTYSRFKQVFVLPIQGNQDKKAAQRLRKLIRPFLLRRLKTDVLTELPEKTEIILQVEMSREEALLYEAQRLKSLENIQNVVDAAGQKPFQILAELTRLRLLCCNPALVVPDIQIQSSKLRVFMDIVRELLDSQHRALVFSQFVGHLALLRQALDTENITYQYLDGSTPAEKREQQIHDFQNGSGDLFLISLKAGGTGLNLTAADYVIHMDPWWNPAVEDQASDRAHRIGQTRPVTVYRLVVKDSIEERIVDLHTEKRELAESLLSGSETAGRLSASELLALIQATPENRLP